MKLDTMQAIKELQDMLKLIPYGQLITISGQRKEAALKMAIEALHAQAGCYLIGSYDEYKQGKTPGDHLD